MIYVGVDVHKKGLQACDDGGRLEHECTFRTSSRGIEDFIMKLEAFRDTILVALHLRLIFDSGPTSLLTSAAFELFCSTLLRQGLSLRLG